MHKLNRKVMESFVFSHDCFVILRWIFGVAVFLDIRNKTKMELCLSQ